MSSAGLTAEDQRELQQFLETEQAKARVQQSISRFTDLCWDKCLGVQPGGISTSFARGQEACLANCVERFLDSSIFLVKKLEEQRTQL